MTLDIGSGSSRPYVKFNSKAGRWYIRGESDDVEIQPPTFIVDFDNIVQRLVSGFAKVRRRIARSIRQWALARSGRRQITSADLLSCATRRSSSAAPWKCRPRLCISAMRSKTPTRLMKPAKAPILAKCRFLSAPVLRPPGQVRPKLQAGSAVGKWVDRPHELPERCDIPSSTGCQTTPPHTTHDRPRTPSQRRRSSGSPAPRDGAGDWWRPIPQRAFSGVAHRVPGGTRTGETRSRQLGYDAESLRNWKARW